MHANILTCDSIGSSQLTDQQRSCLLNMVDADPGVTAVLPRQIPLQKLVAMSSEMGDLLIEFDSFDSVPAGSVRVRLGREDMPARLKRRLTTEAIIADALSLKCIKSPDDAFGALDALRNEGSLHQEKYLGAKKRVLQAEIAKAKPLEVPSLFMGYSPDELHIANWVSAITAWSRRSPEGKKMQLQGSIETAASMLFVDYRDEFRLTAQKDISTSLKNPRSSNMVRSASALWGDDYNDFIECDPGPQRSGLRIRQ